MRKAGNTGAVYGLAVIFGLPGCGMVVKAVTAARHGDSFAVQAPLGVAMLAGAITLAAVARRMTRRNAPGSIR
ncbi:MULTISPECIES: hypothetical protein [unclassified Streptomyces]